MTNESEGKFAGVRVGGAASRVLVGARDDDDTFTASILIDSSTSYYTFYYFTWGLDRLAGRSWTFLKTSSLSGSGLPLFGSKIYGANISQEVFENSSSEKSSDAHTLNSDDVMEKIASLVNHGKISTVVKIGDRDVGIAEIQEIARSLIQQSNIH